MRVPFPNQVPEDFRKSENPGSSKRLLSALHGTSTSSKHSPKEDAQPRQSTSRRPTAGEKRSHRRRDKARIVIDIDVPDDSSYEEQPAEDKRYHNHCSHRNHHSHSDDDKVPHQRLSQRYEPEPAAERERRRAISENQHRKKSLGEKMLAWLSTVPRLRGPTLRLLGSPVIDRNLTLTTDSSSSPFHPGPSNEAKAARYQQEVEEFGEREVREMRDEREREAQRRRSSSRASFRE
ncbi:hypothetical protein E4U61_004918 [Claviceps capensis]|nr:hypothetical protein E4U61_004918 [Claviceps capensis]